MTPSSVDPNGTIHPDWQLRQEENLPRFVIYVHGVDQGDEAEWTHKLQLNDRKYQDSDGYEICAIAAGSTWTEAFAQAGKFIDEALASDRCIF